MSHDTLLIIDGNSLAHRAFHAVPHLSTSRGLSTNAAFGFTNMLLKVLAEKCPDRVAVAFDIGKINFRHDEYGAYKAHRKPTPEELRPQFPVIKDILRAMRIPIFEIEGYEADDLIGTLSAKAEESGIHSVILTADRDTLQLVSPLTKVLLTRKGISELEEYDEGKVWERYGIPPHRITDLKGLTGDTSDNIPGIPGVGEKTAVRLLKEYGSLEEVLTHAGELSGKLREQVSAYGKQAEMSKRLATIDRKAPLAVDLEACVWPGPDYQKLLEIFKTLEFKTLIKSIYWDKKDGKASAGGTGKEKKPFPGPELEAGPPNARIIRHPSEFAELIQLARQAGKVAMHLTGTPVEGVSAAGFAVSGTAPCFLDPGALAENGRDRYLEALRVLCEDRAVKKYLHHGKEAIRILASSGIGLESIAFDTMIAAYLINPAVSNAGLRDVSLEHLNRVLPDGPQLLPAGAQAVNDLVPLLEEKMRLQEQDRLFFEVELPLVEVLAAMEMHGLAVDKNRLEEMSKELAAMIEGLAEEIYRLAGREFNINSTRQLAKVLFEDLKLPAGKKTKTGYSTGAEVLEELAGSHEVVARVLEYRQLVKLKSTYTDGLKALINPSTGRLHTTFNQTVTATGRLSSTEPNLQNIPIRMEQGRRIRKVFIPSKPGNLLLSADYSQIELRILAHMSADPVLLSAFKNNEDIHTRTASEVFGLPPEAVTRELRNRAKAVNFGIVYGLSDFGLARDIKVSRSEARRYIDSYFNRYAGVKNYIDRVVREARQKGYVTTLLNRRRYLPDLFSPNRTVRAFGERTAVNTPIQGSAADIIKMAMVNIHRELKEHGFAAKMVLQVHDELIFDAPEEEIPALALLVRRRMENALALDVPLVVDIKVGPNWYEVRKIDFLDGVGQLKALFKQSADT
ncbi:MAG: DNA polymerase I [Firmicutes bacterium]|nr:DNA polymerase I [Bacillota bacterium]